MCVGVSACGFVYFLFCVLLRLSEPKQLLLFTQIKISYRSHSGLQVCSAWIQDQFTFVTKFKQQYICDDSFKENLWSIWAAQSG